MIPITLAIIAALAALALLTIGTVIGHTAARRRTRHGGYIPITPRPTRRVDLPLRTSDLDKNAREQDRLYDAEVIAAQRGFEEAWANLSDVAARMAARRLRVEVDTRGSTGPKRIVAPPFSVGGGDDAA